MVAEGTVRVHKKEDKILTVQFCDIFEQFGLIVKKLGYEFENRSAHSNQHANSLTNSLLNYEYAILKSCIRRGINDAVLDNAISFLHFLGKGQNSSLTFDLMELWRVNIDYSVLETMREMKQGKKKNFGWTDNYAVEITSDTAQLLIEKIRANLSLEEILHNVRRFASYLTGKTLNLTFDLQPIRI
ncbi:MAG: CRISPR-associated endonuclease Cas1, partial [archaeon]|nr:CRISPR-associated endonuclease Cas1 [archaeon]